MVDTVLAALGTYTGTIDLVSGSYMTLEQDNMNGVVEKALEYIGKNHPKSQVAIGS
jgi:hypothetical protein